MHLPHVNRRILTVVAALAVGGIALTACGSSGGGSDTEAATTAPSAPAAGQPAAEQALADGRTVIDVRTPEEFAEGHIEGAQDIDLQDASFPSKIGALDPKGSYVVYCRSGNRSAQAAQEMRDLGLDVVDGGGIGDMQAAGWELATA